MLRSLLLIATLGATLCAQQSLHVTPSTMQWGYFAAGVKPALTVKPGTTVAIDTIVGIPDLLLKLGAPADDAGIREMQEMYAKVKDRGPGPHFLTGPVAIEGAMPGDVLEVEILEVRLRSPYGWMMMGGTGILADEFRAAKNVLIKLDRRRQTAEFGPGLSLPVRPFFGNMGVAPAEGRVGSGQPATIGANLDNKWLVAGTKLYLPVQVPGALFAAGDGHAVQADGELSGTAIETNLTGVFRFAVRKNVKLGRPRAETPTHFMTMGMNKDLDEAAREATREMIDYLAAERGLSREDAYLLASAAVDLHITQVVNGVKGVHAMLPKAIFKPAR
jgi:acetamidase/formamidase